MPAQDPLLERIVARLREVPGIAAIVLGGSQARGNATASSDVDLGLYYRADAPIDTAALDQAVQTLVDTPRPGLVTPIGEWGPWINGGGWLTVQGQPVDLLYRDLSRVTQVVADACAGRLEVAYQPGHPHAFVSSICLGEIAVCRVLWDPEGVLAPLKAQAHPYPPRLQAATVQRFFWESDFSLQVARKAALRGDAGYVAGCCFRCIACLMQVIFALNEQYLLNEKGAVALAATFPRTLPELPARIAAALACLNGSPTSLTAALDSLAVLVNETQTLIEQAALPHMRQVVR